MKPTRTGVPSAAKAASVVPPPARTTPALLAVGLAAIVSLAFARTVFCDFVNYDDDVYVTANPLVREGLTARGMCCAFTAFRGELWVPLTWLSLMADRELFGSGPQAFHLVNLSLHACNAALLFLVLRTATGSTWRSWLAALLWAVHPLRVESVAWVAERKDVLSMFFALLALLAYVRNAARRSAGGYMLVLVLFSMSLLAKPALVTLPVLMLLMDYWPLGRFGNLPASRAHLLREKVPLIVVAAIASVVAIIAVASGGMAAVEQVPLPSRLANAAVSYARYLWKTVWFGELAVFYPYPSRWPAWQVVGAVVLLIAATTAAFWQRRRRPWLWVGWLWFIIAMLPMIGVVQAGDQAMADRYSYVPAIGLAILVAWSIPQCSARRRSACWGVGIGATLLAVAVLVICSWRQIACWLNSVVLWEQALRVTQDNWVAHNNLGAAYQQIHPRDPAAACAALYHYRRTVEDQTVVHRWARQYGRRAIVPRTGG